MIQQLSKQHNTLIANMRKHPYLNKFLDSIEGSYRLQFIYDIEMLGMVCHLYERKQGNEDYYQISAKMPFDEIELSEDQAKATLKILTTMLNKLAFRRLIHEGRKHNVQEQE